MRKSAILLLVLLMAIPAARVALAQSEVDTYHFIGGEKIDLHFEPVSVGEIKEQVVREDGLITLPTGSNAEIKGKTLEESKRIIATQLQKDTGAKSVLVRILILEYPPRKICVAGEVRTPKIIVLSPTVPMNLFFAIQEAGGITERGDPTHVNLIHVDADGKQVKQVIDTSKLARGDNVDLGPTLIAGDVILVPSLSLPSPDHYMFTGEFVKTGYTVLGDLHLEPLEKPRLSRIILAIGGVRPEADLRKLKILRLRPDGTREVLTPLAEGEKLRDPLLQSGDIIDVPAKLSQKEALQTQSVTITGKVRAPGIYPIGENGLKMSKLILLAGGTTEFAKGKKVTINRPSEKGHLIIVDVDTIIKKGNWDEDVPLMDGDVVNVPERGY